MKTQLASIELYALVSELQVLLNGKIDKIYQPNKNELVLQFHIPSTGKKILRIVVGKFMYLADFKAAADKPSGFCVQLRKNLKGARLRILEQKDFERVVEFVFEQSKGEFISLIIELFGKGNILLVKNHKILMTLVPKIWKDRTLKVGEEYVYPKRDYNLLKFKLDDLKRMLKESDKESLVKSLAMDLGLGGVYAEDICADAGVNKNKIPGDFDDFEKLFKAIERLKKQKPKGFVYKNDIVPYELLQYKSLEHKEFLTYNEALNEVLSTELRKNIADKQIAGYTKEAERINRIIKNQKSTILSLAKKAVEAADKAELLYANYQTVKEIIDEINKALKKLEWDDVKKRLKDHNMVKELNPKDKTVVIEL
ncbi:MAG: NFACT family protein [Nanoarchaeota archaeon]|nr:NFACT family protein [Nanoarchaeota archaeon]